jgi:hypothetical protein
MSILEGKAPWSSRHCRLTAGPTRPDATRIRLCGLWTFGWDGYRLHNAAVERIATDYRWAEGPVRFGDHHCLL